MSTVKSIQLFYQEGSSDKLYNAAIVKDGDLYTVKVEWGRRGGSLNQGSKAVKVALAVAQKKYDSLVREKTNKGYQAITDGVQPAAVAPPEGEGSGSRVGTKRPRVGPVAQLLQAIEEAELAAHLANDKLIAQQKIDGERVLVKVLPEMVVTNREGQRYERAHPRSFEGLQYLPHGTIVDGELLQGGEYWLFDVLQLGADDLRGRGYLERWETLDNELEPALSGNIRVVPIAQGKKAKQRLHDQLRAQGAEGLVFKDAHAPYAAGRGRTQLKCKFIKSADVIILENAGNAYQMAVYDGKKLFACGKVFAGTTNADRKMLDAALGRQERPICEVQYLYATDDHQLFQPKFIRVRDDKAAKDCVRGQLLTTCRTVIV